MFRPPYFARVAAGAAVYALEETRKLPAAVVQLPLTAVSQALQTTMRVQQFVATLAVKGDEALRGLYDQSGEQPEWATFDEDEPAGDREPAAPAGRFALYSAPAAAETVPAPAGPAVGVAAPEIVEQLDYPALTLAQLRARLRTLSATELDELLRYEELGSARAPYVTMLANRIATLNAK